MTISRPEAVRRKRRLLVLPMSIPNILSRGSNIQPGKRRREFSYDRIGLCSHVLQNLLRSSHRVGIAKESGGTQSELLLPGEALEHPASRMGPARRQSLRVLAKDDTEVTLCLSTRTYRE